MDFIGQHGWGLTRVVAIEIGDNYILATWLDEQDVEYVRRLVSGSKDV